MDVRQSLALLCLRLCGLGRGLAHGRGRLQPLAAGEGGRFAVLLAVALPGPGRFALDHAPDPPVGPEIDWPAEPISPVKEGGFER
jgi:hypothetical protein